MEPTRPLSSESFPLTAVPEAGTFVSTLPECPSKTHDDARVHLQFDVRERNIRVALTAASCVFGECLSKISLPGCKKQLRFTLKQNNKNN